TLYHGTNLLWRRMRAKKQTVSQRHRFLTRDEQRVLGVARRMVRGKIQRLEIVVIGLDLRSFLDRISEIAEHGDHFVHGLDDRMLGAERATDAGEGDVG